MKSKTILILFMILFNFFCASTEEAKLEVSSDSDFAIYGADLVLSLVEMVPVLPKFAKEGIRDINTILKKSKMKVSIEFTYKNAYGKKLEDVKEDGDSGQVFANMKEASLYFQKMLKVLKIEKSENYFLASVDTDTDNVLFSVIYRDKPLVVNNVLIGKDSKEFYTPSSLNRVRGTKDSIPDVIIDFAGVPRNLAQTQKMQSILLTVAANSVIMKKKSPEYFTVEKQWLDGNVSKVMKDQGKRF